MIDEALKEPCTMTLPTLRLRVECAMVNPPKPIGVIVFEDERMIGGLTLEEFKHTAAQLSDLIAKSRPGTCYLVEEGLADEATEEA